MDVPEAETLHGKVQLRQKEHRLRVLNLAIKYRNRKFIAHPYSQVMLNTIAYKGSGKWNQLSFKTKFLLMILYTLFMPLCMLGYMFTAPNRLTKKMETSLCKLLALVAMSAFQDKYDSFLRLSPLKETFCVWVKVLVQKKQLILFKHLPRRNIYSFTYLSIFIAVIIGIWVVGIIVQEIKQAMFQKVVYLQMQIKLKSCATLFIKNHHFVLNYLTVLVYTKTIIHLSVACTCSFNRIEGTVETLFWALFGHVEFPAFETDENSKITMVTGQILFAVYSLASILVVLNLLIAMLNNSYKKVDKEKDTKFKFARTRLWMYYISEVSPLPPPFNLIPVEKIASAVRWLARRYNWVKKCLGCIKAEEIKSDTVKTNQKRRRVVIKNLIHRYFSGKQNTLRKEPDKNTTPSDEDTPEEEDEVQTKLMEVTKTLQSLQKAVHQFRRKTPAEKSRYQTKKLK
ncbi:unnamed protein product [Porites lobata]|uniref:Ion transport domain-containing protein n=1 Tax=Porites lobata TaxID=104759 RepID=A0ABN8RG79_9CNID|nr:unnamed protein product [Porites lobata]